MDTAFREFVNRTGQFFTVPMRECGKLRGKAVENYFFMPASATFIMMAHSIRLRNSSQPYS